MSVGCEIQVIMFWKHIKRYICFIINVARPISFSNSSLHRIEINYDHIRSILLYEHIIIGTCFSILLYRSICRSILLYKHIIIGTCFSSQFALGIPSKLPSFRPVIWSAYIIAISQRFNLFRCVKTKTYLNHWNSETNW